ncbi:MAG: RDD family protein [Chloroflexota bacterium]
MNNLDEILQVDTPENVAFGYDVAGIGSRFLAALVDSTILTVGQVAFIALIVILALVNGSEIEDASSLPVWVSALLGMVYFLFYWGYYIFFEIQWNGQSPGKRLAKLRVIRADGLPLTLGESIIRNLVRVVDFLPVAYGVGVITMFIQPQARRLGDLAAGTVVIHDRKAATLGEMTHPQAPAVYLGYHLAEYALPPTFPVERLDSSSVQVAENFLLRRRNLSNSGALAVQIVRSLYQRLGLEYPGMTTAQAEEALTAIVKAYRERQQGPENTF